MAFGPESTNPRERRAYAHAKLAKLRDPGTLGPKWYCDALDEALLAVKAASGTKKGNASGFAGRLARESVIVGDVGKNPDKVILWSPRYRATGQIRVDGYVTDGVEHDVLDIAGQSDSCCVSPKEAAQADEAWREGGVLITNPNWEDNRPALVLPRRSVSAQWIGEALSRHYQTLVSPAELVA